jgi:hypothetical protein
MKIYEKIESIQDKLSLQKDGKNPFYKSKYITLDNILSKLRPLLKELNLILINTNDET